MPEYLLIAITLAVAVVGTIWEKPPTPAKVILILFALGASAASIAKSIEDDQDKKFLQLALTSTLRPSNSEYTRFYDDFDASVAARGYKRDDYPCHHTPEGLTCFLVSPDSTKHGTLVLNKSDVATLYSNLIRNVSNGPASESLFSKQYNPPTLNEEFLDKIGVLGFDTFYNMYNDFPSTYNYDPSFGIRIIWQVAGQQKMVQITPEDIKCIPAGNGLEIFYKIERLYRERFEAANRAIREESRPRFSLGAFWSRLN
jgi:hypothetical protein